MAGRKRVESRFAKARRAPFGRVLAGDKLFLKQSSGAVCATASVAAVKSFEDLTPKRIRELRTEYNHLIVGSDQYWQSRADCAFGFLVWLDDVRAVEPIRISKKDWRAWVILTEKENFGLLKADGQKRGIKK